MTELSNPYATGGDSCFSSDRSFVQARGPREIDPLRNSLNMVHGSMGTPRRASVL